MTNNAIILKNQRDNDAWTLSLLTNRDVLEMHKSSCAARQVSRKDDRIVWSAEDGDGVRFAALLNTGESTAEVSVEMAELGLDGNAEGLELWSRQPVSITQGRLTATVPPHGARLYRMK